MITTVLKVPEFRKKVHVGFLIIAASKSMLPLWCSSALSDTWFPTWYLWNEDRQPAPEPRCVKNVLGGDHELGLKGDYNCTYSVIGLCTSFTECFHKDPGTEKQAHTNEIWWQHIESSAKHQRAAKQQTGTNSTAVRSRGSKRGLAISPRKEGEALQEKKVSEVFLSYGTVLNKISTEFWTVICCPPPSSFCCLAEPSVGLFAGITDSPTFAWASGNCLEQDNLIYQMKR